MSAPRHNVDNWDLVSYDWDEKTGEAMLTYERWVRGQVEEHVVYLAQPAHPSHFGWAERPQ